MKIPLSDQLKCAQAVLAQMRDKNSRWLEAQEGVVATIERQMMLEQISNEIAGRKTEEVEITKPISKPLEHKATSFVQ